jgi:F-type H+-transporting ATPase subunit delta
MNILQIKELAASIVKYDEFSKEYLDWIYSNLSRQDIKLFVRLLSKEIKNNAVTISFAGSLSDTHKRKINAMFPNKKILLKRDDANIVGGARFEYGDFILDCSVLGVVKRTLSAIASKL